MILFGLRNHQSSVFMQHLLTTQDRALLVFGTTAVNVLKEIHPSHSNYKSLELSVFSNVKFSPVCPEYASIRLLPPTIKTALLSRGRQSLTITLTGKSWFSNHLSAVFGYCVLEILFFSWFLNQQNFSDDGYVLCAIIISSSQPDERSP